MVETYQRNIKEIEGDLHEKKSDENESQKYEILYQKEKEINDFMTNFEDEKVQYEGEINVHQTTIAALLEHMGKNMARQDNLPSASQVKDSKGDLDHKKGQLENAENTFARLKVELE
jgi:intraflagellar transport protein 74